MSSRRGYNPVFESPAGIPAYFGEARARNFSAIFHKKGDSSSDRKESGNAEGRESTDAGWVAVFRVSSRDDGPVALAEASSVI